MKQGTLFDLSEIKLPEKLTIKSGLTCRNCKHRYKHEYGKMFYCSQQRQKGTAYGDKKIKAGDTACHIYIKND